MTQALQLWYFKEGNRAHEKQGAALIEALKQLRPCQVHPIETANYRFGMTLSADLAALPKPDVLLGAGHGTHWPILRCKMRFGGHAVVIMKPSLPLAWFDSAIIPRHDQPKDKASTFISQGMLNPSFVSQADKAHGVILLGGINKYFAWSQARLIEQIQAITAATPDCHWQVSNSRRTPADFDYRALERENVSWIDWQSEGPQWLPQQLAKAGRIWVSCDSMSMIYEALNSRAQVGVLSLEPLKHNKMVAEITRLKQEGVVMTEVIDMEQGSFREPLNEHIRAASWLLSRL